jgi:hypothetical protein
MPASASMHLWHWFIEVMANGQPGTGSEPIRQADFICQQPVTEQNQPSRIAGGNRRIQ